MASGDTTCNLSLEHFASNRPFQLFGEFRGEEGNLLHLSHPFLAACWILATGISCSRSVWDQFTLGSVRGPGQGLQRVCGLERPKRKDFLTLLPAKQPGPPTQSQAMLPEEGTVLWPDWI